MTIHLPEDVERSLEAAVISGRFLSLDDAMTEAARLLLRELEQRQQEESAVTSGFGSIGAMRENAGLLDEIVADAYQRRREEKWREFDL